VIPILSNVGALLNGLGRVLNRRKRGSVDKQWLDQLRIELGAALQNLRDAEIANSNAQQRIVDTERENVALRDAVSGARSDQRSERAEFEEIKRKVGEFALANAGVSQQAYDRIESLLAGDE
jgi:hypothetical protein